VIASQALGCGSGFNEGRVTSAWFEFFNFAYGELPQVLDFCRGEKKTIYAAEVKISI
jgi:hypothetical protein